MVTQKQAFDYYMDMYQRGSIYVWGFNSGTTISTASIQKAYQSFGSAKYNKAYYDAKLKQGLGKNGSDCSGAHYGISGYDTTAQGYYNRCKKKGTISTLPKDKLVLLFNGTASSAITHTGVYMGNGMVFHMKSSAANAVYEKLNASPWKFWGYADFINDYAAFSFDTDKWDNKNWIKQLQNAFGLKADGVWTSAALGSVINVSRTSNRNHASVKLLQEKLNHLGFSCGKADGVFGTNTYKGVLAFQKNHGLAADGIVGKNTWKKLIEI